ncbi:aminoglycoside phosphotransferase family protein [Pseudidiomarina terrestris]|uniref:Phosphotransferase n=1 Tax=Pseudidiomarina terrestris TaxID=2820060 RepID=A0AAW7R3J6_9GAMM|nr:MULTISPECIES: phosphotransferase [unclassified Pseudidiomarina]MDN7125245.1 phosphotransferase [Pseudidiomarina sp. 1APP75-32.1]MDN7136156.1 phosphotransferase [Pseudidiomarina sp. 1ASP75-5]MEA3588905.1 phosphotransferase [Pseudidiomarina sp. 1APP75-27a]
MENKREVKLQAWCEAVTGHPQQDLQPVFGDARPWRYYRTHDGLRSLIAVDTMNTEAVLENYLAVADAYSERNIAVPELVAVQQQHGFMLITDLGSSLLLSHLSEHSLSDWYAKVFADLGEIMRVRETQYGALPEFNRTQLQAELDLLPEWLVKAHLQIEFTAAEQEVWERFCATLVDNATAQPQVGVHRKFHARNVLVQGDKSLAYTGFHDAVIGPITYDVVSLLRDCYVRWPEEQVRRLSAECFDYLCKEQSDLVKDVDSTTWQRWFDLMGLQRHAYASGLFARRYQRDGNPGYVQDIPRNLGYLHDVAAIYPEFDDFRDLLKDRILPAMAALD